MVEAQRGDVRMVDDPSKLPQARIIETFSATRSGYTAQMDAQEVALAAFELGAGREKKGDPIDPAVGVKVHAKIGDQVDSGAPLVTIYANDDSRLAACRAHLERAVAYSDTPVDPLPLFYDTIYGEKA
jgi:pyrimidine-nucleoside phosphorylase